MDRFAVPYNHTGFHDHRWVAGFMVLNGAILLFLLVRVVVTAARSSPGLEDGSDKSIRYVEEVDEDVRR